MVIKICKQCNCGYASYEDLETGAGKGEMTWKNELDEKSEA